MTNVGYRDRVGDWGSGGPFGVTAAVEVRLLGGFGLVVDGKPVPTGSWRLRKARDVVKILALAPGHRRHRDEVIEALWPERDTDSGLNNLHQALHIARRGLAGDAAAGSGTGGSGTRSAGRARLRVRDEWVALCPDEPLRVDVEAFEAAATAAEGSGDPACVEAALSLYLGELLPEDRYEDWAAARRDELSARHRRLVTELAALREAAGDPRAAVDLLAPLAAGDPTDEVAQRALIRGYALAGDRGAALRQYQALADALRDGLAVPPDGRTEQLRRDVLAGRLGEPPRPRETPEVPRQRATTQGRQRARPGLRAGHNLPIRLSTFVGREQALAELSAMLGQRRLITLLGPGGCGKSRLAVEVAQRAVGRFPDGVWLAELAVTSGTGDEAVGRALARDLAVGEQSGQSPLGAVAVAMAGKRSLLVIDNCEYRIDSAARAVAALLAASQDVVVLATSREPLRVPGEALWQVPSLTMPDPALPPAVHELRKCESVRLFTDRAMAADPGFTLDADNAGAVAEICFRLDGLPLAIELAAARVPALGTRGIAERLDDRFRLLTSGSRTALTRQRTLADTFDWSYELLSEPEQAAFRRVSVFAETFSLPAAAAVAAGGEVEREDIAVVLPDLVARSMVAIEHEALTFRYRLIETLREYGRVRLAETGESAAVRGRHAAWFLTLAREAAEHFADPGRRRWLERLDADQADLQAALSTLTGTEPAARAGPGRRAVAVLGHARQLRRGSRAAAHRAAGRQAAVGHPGGGAGRRVRAEAALGRGRGGQPVRRACPGAGSGAGRPGRDRQGRVLHRGPGLDARGLPRGPLGAAGRDGHRAGPRHADGPGLHGARAGLRGLVAAPDRAGPAAAARGPGAGAPGRGRAGSRPVLAADHGRHRHRAVAGRSAPGLRGQLRAVPGEPGGVGGRVHPRQHGQPGPVRGRP